MEKTREHIVALKISKEEHKALKSLSFNEGLTIAAMVRRLILRAIRSKNGLKKDD